MLCFVLEKILTHVKQVVQSVPAFCSCIITVHAHSPTFVTKDGRLEIIGQPSKGSTVI